MSGVAGTARPGLTGTSESDGSTVAATAGVLADGPSDGNCPANGDATGGASPAAAAHCVAVNYNCCKILLRNRQPAASGRELRIPD